MISAHDFFDFPSQHEVYMKESDMHACVFKERTSLCDS